MYSDSHAIFSEMKNALPDLLTVEDLVKMGLYKNKRAAYDARRRGVSPEFFKIERRVLYSRENVVEFLEKSLKRR